MTKIVHRPLGKGALSVSAVGLGCMSLSGVYGAAEDAQSEALIQHAIDSGINHLDSSDMYGWGHNEEVVGRALKGGRRDSVVLATKFGQVRGEGGGNAVNGRPEYVQAACDASLKRLGVQVIDLYYQHRVDPSVPVEDTVGAMSRLVEQGKVRFLGLSEARPERIRRAHAVHPIAAVQTEYSLLYRTEAEETRQTTRELGIGFVAYSPLGRGFLTGALKSLADIDGRRAAHPRFQAEHFDHNRALAARIEGIAARKGCWPRATTWWPSPARATPPASTRTPVPCRSS
jgi:aryl-alcohol dehydrogenase-like predicted oxidoreductase